MSENSDSIRRIVNGESWNDFCDSLREAGKLVLEDATPADPLPACSVLFTTLINAASDRVWITSPYFVPDDVLTRALPAAALRGVDVRILLPGKA